MMVFSELDSVAESQAPWEGKLPPGCPADKAVVSHWLSVGYCVAAGVLSA